MQNLTSHETTDTLLVLPCLDSLFCGMGIFETTWLIGLWVFNTVCLVWSMYYGMLSSKFSIQTWALLLGAHVPSWGAMHNEDHFFSSVLPQELVEQFPALHVVWSCPPPCPAVTQLLCSGSVHTPKCSSDPRESCLYRLRSINKDGGSIALETC